MALVWNGTLGGAHQDPAGASTITFTGMNTGTAASDRISVFMIGFAVGFPAVSVTVHSPNSGSDPTGTACTLIAATNGGVNFAQEEWYCANPSNTTADVVVVLSGSNFGISMNVGSLTGANSTPGTPQTFAGTAGSSTLTTANVTIPSGGICIMAVDGAAPSGLTGGTIDLTTSGTNATETTGFATTAGTFTPTATGCTNGAEYGGFHAIPWAAASGGAAPPTGWDYIQDDIYPKRAQSVSAAPAFVSTFRTAGIAGISWSGPRDHAKLPPSVVFSAPPAFARPIVAASVPISGMAWDTLHETDILPKGRFLTDPVAIAYIPQTVTWSFLVGDTTFLRDAPMDSPPGYGHTAFSTPVPISGMAWFTPLDWSKPQISFTTPPAYAVNVAPVVNTNSGIPWFEPPDRDRPAYKVTVEAPPAIALTPATLPVPIRGMAWFIPPGPLNKGTLGTDWPPYHTLKPTVQLVTLSKRRPTLFIANVGRLMN